MCINLWTLRNLQCICLVLSINQGTSKNQFTDQYIITLFPQSHLDVTPSHKIMNREGYYREMAWYVDILWHFHGLKWRLLEVCGGSSTTPHRTAPIRITPHHDNSPLGQFPTRTTPLQDNSQPGKLPTRTTPHQDNSPLGQFPTRTTPH